MSVMLRGPVEQVLIGWANLLDLVMNKQFWPKCVYKLCMFSHWTEGSNS